MLVNTRNSKLIGNNQNFINTVDRKEGCFSDFHVVNNQDIWGGGGMDFDMNLRLITVCGLWFSPYMEKTEFIYNYCTIFVLACLQVS